MLKTTTSTKAIEMVDEVFTNKKGITWLTMILLVILVIFVVLLGSMLSQSVLRENPSEVETIKEFHFKIGISGFSPVNYPDFDAIEFSQYWQTIQESVEVFGINTDWRDTDQINAAAQNHSGDISLVLGYQDREEWGNEVENLIGKVSDLMSRYPQIKYLGIGNEINILRDNFPDSFPKYKADYIKTYTDLKAQFPSVQIFPTFQFESLQGNAYLLYGEIEKDANWDLLTEFDEYMDLVALTVYPYLDFREPKLIPENYFTQVKEVVDKPILITETGWMSRETYGGELSRLNSKGYTGSEVEQAKYLERLAELASNSNVETVMWTNLNDLFDWQEGDSPEHEYKLFDSIGLHYNDGRRKLAWDLWLNLLAGVGRTVFE